MDRAENQAKDLKKIKFNTKIIIKISFLQYPNNMRIFVPKIYLEKF